MGGIKTNVNIMSSNMDPNCNWSPGLRMSPDYVRWLNNATFLDYYYRLKDLAISEFKWTGLPETCDERFLELILFEFGYALFFQHNINKAYLTLQCTIAGKLNMYRKPIERRAYAITGFNQLCNDLDSVLIFNNFLRTPTSFTVELFAKRLAEVEAAISGNLSQQKTPVVIKATKEQKLSYENAAQRRMEGYPLIFVDKTFDTNSFELFPIDVPQNFNELIIAKQRIWNEAMNFLGIDNANTDKKERMITQEIESNNQQVEMSRFTRLNARRQAAEEINRLFGLDVSVDFRPLSENTGLLPDAGKQDEEVDDGILREI